MIKRLSILILLLIAACSEIYDVPSVFEIKVVVKYPSIINDGEIIPGITVKLKNKQTGREYIELTNESGVATFNVRGGNYDIVASLIKELEVNLNGELTKDTFIFNGLLAGQTITESGKQLEIQTNFSFASNDFIIKELYVSGSRTPEGKSYGADKFIEIYNNTNKILYADGLCYGAVHPITTFKPTPWVDEEGNLLNRCPVWSFVPIVPGTGNEHPIQPGESFVIALSALNHRDDPNGNPNSNDLSAADWEMYAESSLLYIDVPSVPNMLMQKITKTTTMTLGVQGQVSIIFRLPSNNLDSIFTNPNNYMIQPGGSERCFMVPWNWVADGVENVQLDDRGVYKRLPSNIDLGYIQFRGSYEGVSIRRKVTGVNDGRVIYQDTNNSSEDFLTDQIPQPGIISAD